MTGATVPSLVVTAIRDATPADVDEICALIRELAEYERLAHEVVATAEGVARALFGPEPVARVTIAEVDGSVAGFALWFPTFSTFLGCDGIWLEDLFVRPPHRRAGIGLALLQDLRARTPGRVEWAVLDWNEPAISFYEGLGAEPVRGWTRFRWLPPEE
jgi:GNAT superfamily N-acetyltransferase